MDVIKLIIWGSALLTYWLTLKQIRPIKLLKRLSIKFKQYFFCLLFLMLSLNLYAIEFFIEIDQSTGEFTKINEVTEVASVTILPDYTTFDEVSNQYIFRGTANNNEVKLYTLNAETGSIVYNPPFPDFPDPSDNIRAFIINRNTGTLYGLYRDNSQQSVYLSYIDRVFGTNNNLYEIEGAVSANTLPDFNAFNENLNYISFGGTDVNEIPRIYTIDLYTTELVASPQTPILPFSDYIEGMQYDRNTQKYYALYWDDSEQTMYLIDINPLNANFEILFPIADVQTITCLPNFICFDETNGQYIFRGGDNNQKLYTVSVNTGEVIYNPIFPILDDPNDNIKQLMYDNVGQKLYASHWDAVVESTEPNNPPTAVNDEFEVYTNCQIAFNILENDYDEDGDEFSIVYFSNGTSNIYAEIQFNSSTGEMAITPYENFDSDTMYYNICDNYNLCDTGFIVLTNVECSLPQDGCIENIIEVNYNQPIEFSYENAFAVDNSTTINNGTLTAINNNTLQYQPAEGFVGYDDFPCTLELTDCCTYDGFQGIYLNVNAQIDSTQIIAENDLLIVQGECTEYNIAVLENDIFNQENYDLSIIEISSSIEANINNQTNEILIFIENQLYESQYLIYEICDSTGLCETATLEIIEESCPTPEPPISIDATTSNNQTIDLIMDASALPYYTVSTSFNGTLTVLNDTTVQYQAATGFIGTDSWISQELYVSECCGTWLTGGISIVVEVTEATFVGLNEMNDELIQVGPNPFFNEIKVSSYSNELFNLMLYDLIGNLIISSNQNNYLNKLEDLPSSMYVLKIETEKESMFKKLFKQ